MPLVAVPQEELAAAMAERDSLLALKREKEVEHLYRRPLFSPLPFIAFSLTFHRLPKTLVR